MKSKNKSEWILMVHLLPPKPTNLRVRIWRKLNNLGAVAIKNSVYVLPFNEKTHEDFEWLRQEIETAGGEANVFRAESVEGTADEEIIDIFRRERDKDFSKIAAEFDALAGAVKEQKQNNHLTAERIKNYETELGKLHSELERIKAVDFFVASVQKTAVASFKRAQKILRVNFDSSRKVSPASGANFLSRSDYQGKRWVTRLNMHIDRLASAWLIKRFIDERPKFYFVVESEKVTGAIHFDMFEAEFTHAGEDCTFETLLNRFGLTDNAALREIAEIVHDIDLKDGKFNRLEAVGLDATIRGLSKLLRDDRKLLAQCGFIFDGLYEQFSANIESPIKQSNAEGERND
ncbi:MAG: chromate resistance protein [Acidobacteriota bacterium]|jgi:hypothetical protein|nr:chromate resistance protein [Acidobacteriota bacterium]MDQ3322797.1 chromate resistance protein [Acidobacteriota bacterium]